MIRSTTHSGLEVTQTGLQLYYDVGNPNSYKYESPTTNRLYNLARLDDIIIQESGSAATINSSVYENIVPSNVPYPFNGVLKNTTSDYLETPGFIDFEDVDLRYSYSIEMFFKIIQFSTSNPSIENYLIKSADETNGLYVKFNETDNRDLEIGSTAATPYIYRTAMAPADLGNPAGFYHFVFVRNYPNNDIFIYVNRNEELNRKQTLYTTFQGPVKIAYGFNEIWLSQFKLYNTALSQSDVNFNYNQYNNFRFE
jgi:hypothetical protein